MLCARSEMLWKTSTPASTERKVSGAFHVALVAGAMETLIASDCPAASVVSPGEIGLLVNGVAYQHVGAADSLSIWMYTTLVTLAVVVVFVSFGELMGGAQANQTEGVAPAAAETPPPMQAAATPPVLERVPLPQRGRLLALTVEDHYVDIVTDRGKTLVLMRLADAIREAAPVPGLQIHRSHWVALDAVRRTERSDGKTTVELSNGLRLPISRGYMAMARDAGLVG